MRFTIANADHRSHKCITCSSGRVTWYDDGRRVTVCAVGMSNADVDGNVTKCTDYTFNGSHAPHAMERIAWVLEVKRGRVVGFKAPGSEE